MRETQVPSPGQEDPLEKEMATHSSILAWRIPMDTGAWWAAVHGVAKSQTQLSDFTSYGTGLWGKVNFVQMFNSILWLDLIEDKITGDFFLNTDGKHKKSHI